MNLDLEPQIQKEFERVCSQCSDLDTSVGHRCLTLHDVLRAHFLIANHFFLEGNGLGGIGPKNMSLLESAIHRQNVQFAGIQKWDNLFDVCATLFYGLIKNHPFHDANKRTAFLCALIQLYRYGLCPATSEKEFENLTVEVAENSLGKYARFADLVRTGEADPEIRFVAWFLRKHTRQIDNSHYSITFNELQRILNRFNFGLSNPKGNHIQVVRYEDRREFLLFGRRIRNEIRVGQIGFPRWSAQVNKGALKSVREMTRLTPKQGVDSASFFKGVDPMQSLIATYNEPLMRLAQR